MRKYVAILAIVLVAILCFGCSAEKDNLVIGMVPSTSPETLKKRFEAIRVYLEQELALQVELFVPDDYVELIEGMAAKKVDIGLYGPFSYIIADKQQHLTPLVVRVRQDMGVTYNSLLVVHSDTPFRTLEDIRGKKIAFVNSASTSGYIIPYALFTSRGIDISKHFSDHYFAGSHDLVAEDVLNGVCDVGAMSKSILKGLEQRKQVDTSKLRILWESEPIPGSPFVARADLNEKLRADFIEAMLSIHTAAPETLGAFSQSVERFVPIEPKLYNSIRNIVNVLGEDFIIRNYLKE